MTDTPKSSDNLFADVLNAKNAAGAAAPATDPIPQDDETETTSQPDELAMLKQRARLMGIVFSNNIKVETLRAKIAAKLNNEQDPDENQDGDDETGDAAGEAVDEVAVLKAKLAQAEAKLQEHTQDDEAPRKEPVQSKSLNKVSVRNQKRRQQYLEQMKLVRLRITNLNPAKKDLPGEIFTFANRVLGSVKKYVPYGEVTDNGYHVPFCIYTQLKDREFLSISTKKDNRGRERVETRMVKEFALEVLPPLTEKELAALAAQQAASKGIE